MAEDQQGESSTSILMDSNVAAEQSEPDNEQELPSLKFTPLDFETQEMRFLILKPHHGNINSRIECSFSLQPLTKCEPYT